MRMAAFLASSLMLIPESVAIIAKSARVIIPLLIFSSSCATVKPIELNQKRIAIGDEFFCAVARNKSAYIGTKLVLTGTYQTDFIHGSRLAATCNGEETGFVMGYGPDTLNINDPRLKPYCKTSCRVEIDVTVTGSIAQYEDGYYLDFTEIIFPEDLTQ